MPMKSENLPLVQFFAAVQHAAEAHGIGAFAIAAVLPMATTDNLREVKVAANAVTRIEGASEEFTEGYCQAMVDALDEALSGLTQGEAEEVTEYKN